MLSTFFIKRPIFATVISLVILLIGGITIPLLPVEKTPDITPPTVVVQARYPGANAQVVAETVATPLEEQINGVDGLLYMSSNCSDDGSMQLTATFEVGTDVDMATVLVQNRVAMAEPMLPEEVKRYGVTTQKQSTNITLVVCLRSPERRFDETYMSNYINIYLKDPLSRVPGVGSVMVFGAKDFSMRIWLDPQLLKARNLSAMDVIGAIREQNVQVAPGQLGAPPSPRDQEFQYTIKTLGRLTTVEQFSDIILKTQEDGRILRLRDVARIELGSELYSWFVEYNGAPSVAMGIFQLPGANSLEVAKNIRQAMDSLSRDFPEGLEHVVAFDPTLFISESIREVLFTLIFAVFLVVLSVYIFLQDWRATLIPTITIPVSLIGALAVMMLFGMSVNTLTLFGLVLSIGIVVDDAIVVVENTQRIIDEEGLPRRQASIKAMQQITGPVIATTLVLLAVFVPTALIGGISGRLYSQFAITISTATVFSTFNALTLSPALCALFLRPSPGKHWGFFGLFNKFMRVSTRGYISVVGHITRSTLVSMVLYGVIVFSTFLGFRALRSGFLPNEDEGFFLLNVELPSGASLQRTRAVTDQVNRLLSETDGIAEFVGIGGWAMLSDSFAPSGATYFVMLDSWEKRPGRALSAEMIVEQINGRLQTIQDATCRAFAPPPIMGLGMVGGFEVQVQDRGGAGQQALQEIGDKLVMSASASPVMMFANSTFRANVPQLYLDIDRTKAKRLGVSLDAIFSTLQANLGTFYVNDLNLFGRTYKVLTQGNTESRNRREDILALEVPNRQGQMVPLRTFTVIEDMAGPQNVFHYNLYPSTTLSGAANFGFSSGQAMKEMERLLQENLPSTMGYEWSGMSYQEIQAGNKAPIIFALASIFVFLFLAAQYESWFIPVSIVMSVPLALFGAVLATFLRMLDNNIYTQIGLVLLIGQASKTAILLVEFAKQHHEEGHSIVESAVAASRLRFRPILMTALSFVFGVFPLVIATGAGSAARRALGTAVFGGMLVATILGIFLIPVSFVVIQRFNDWIWPKSKAEV
ncbi:MAG: multidrug efflux RND transporter permease subunit [Sedimentisphaerales bacterium]|nr:multidrug efflux RND transporter permease subunit [Sedimentisphaerales bacterium]